MSYVLHVIIRLLVAVAALAALLSSAPGQAADPLPPKLNVLCANVNADFTQTGSGWPVTPAATAWMDAQWAYRGAYTITLHQVRWGCADIRVHRYYSTTDGQCAFTNWDRVWPATGYDAAGRPLVSGADIYLNDVCVSAGTAYAKRTIVHELGHAMGLPHSTSSRSVMNTAISWPIPAQPVAPVDARDLALTY
jgi:hypothetical protein